MRRTVIVLRGVATASRTSAIVLGMRRRLQCLVNERNDLRRSRRALALIHGEG